MTKLCFDYDPLLYSVGGVGEQRTIKVVHRQSGDEYEFPNRTAFWGHSKKKAGGWLSEWNAAKSEENRRKPEEFDITDIQTPEPVGNLLRTLKQSIQAVKEATGASRYYGYSGKGKTFREDVSTIIKYKGNRDNAIRPVLLDELKEYLIRHHDCRIVTEIEADDACSIDSYEAWQKWKKTRDDKDKLVLACVDKDYLQCASHIYNINEAGDIDSYDGFGKLFINDKKEVRGRGRLWLYQQVLDGDDADNYFANCASDLKWAQMSAYKLLKDCKTDKEALQALVTGYKTLYPSPKKIIGWRGEEIEIDWLYVLKENFQLARMLRWREDKVDVEEVMKKLGVEYADAA